jgi:hypothetical protein
MQGIKLTLALLSALSLSGTASAALMDLGDGLIYDTVLDVTWLQNANTDGDSGWAAANAWAQALEFGGASNWRLPSLSVAGGLPTGSIPGGVFVNCVTQTEEECRDNELGYMYRYNLGGTVGDDLTGDQGLIQDIQAGYWTGSLLDGDPTAPYAFFFDSGGTASGGPTFDRTRWAVHPGMVPEPGTALLLGMGLAGLGVARRSKRQEGKATA